MNTEETSKVDLDTDEDFKRQLEIAKGLAKSFERISHASSKLENLQLQLITVAGATFSIYVAFGTQTPSSLTRWGFVLLAVSLLAGLLSVLTGYYHIYMSAFVEMGDLEKQIFISDKARYVRQALARFKYVHPLAYDSKLDLEVASGHQKVGLEFVRELFTSGLHSLSGVSAGIQFLSLLFATLLLLLGLILV